MLKFSLILILIISTFYFLPVSLAATPQNPLVYDDSLYVSNNGVYKFNQATLKRQWVALQGLQTFEPVMGKNLLYVGSPQGLYALDPDTGRQVWRIEAMHTLFTPSIGGQLYAGSLHGVLYAIDPASGDINWQQNFEGWIYSPVVLPDKNQLWTGGQAHLAIAVSSEDGRRIHTVSLDQELIFSPIDLQNQQVAFNLFNGKTAIINTISAEIEGWLEGSTQPINLSYDEDYLYRTDRDGKLTAFDRINYQRQWQATIARDNLTIHPGYGDHILMSDTDRVLVLFDPIKRIEARQETRSGNWFLPVHTDKDSIIYFYKNILQPNALSAVKINARLPN